MGDLASMVSLIVGGYLLLNDKKGWGWFVAAAILIAMAVHQKGV